MPRKVYFLGSNKVVAEALCLYVEDELDNTGLAVVTSLLCCGISVKGVDSSDKQIDYVTRAYSLQTQLMPFLPSCAAHYEIRALAGKSSGLDLTLKPAQWSRYYAAYDTGGDTKVAQTLNDELAAAWNYLKENRDAPIVVTCHRDDETTLERLKNTHPENVRDLWVSLPDRLKKNMRVTVAFLSSGKITFADADHAKNSLEANVAYVLAHKSQTAFPNLSAPPMHADLRFRAAVAEAFVRGKIKWCWNRDCTICKPNLYRVLNNVFSDVLHNELSPGEYTRDDVLARVKTYGSIVQLHDPCYRQDAEVITEAYNNLKRMWPSQHVSGGLFPACFKDDKSVVIAAVGYDATLLEEVSDRLQRDSDVCRAALTSHWQDHLTTICRSVVQHDPVVAAYMLMAQRNIKLHAEPQIDKQVVLDLVATNSQHLRAVFMVARQRAKRKNPFWKQAACKLVQDQEFIMACVRRNWRTTEMLLTNHWCQWNCTGNKPVFATLLRQLTTHFGPAKSAASYHIISRKYWTNPDMVRRRFMES